MNNNYNELIKEIIEHLKLKRNKLALITSKKLVDLFSENPKSYSLYAESLLENLNPFQALDIINYAVEISANSPEIRLDRAFILYRLSIFDGALADIEYYLSHMKNDSKTLLLKAKTLAASERYFEALELLEDINGNLQPEENVDILLDLIKISLDITAGTVEKIKNENELLNLCNTSMNAGYYWFTPFVHKTLFEKFSDEKPKTELKLLLLISLTSMFRIKEAEKLSDELKNIFITITHLMKFYRNFRQLINSEQLIANL